MNNLKFIRLLKRTRVFCDHDKYSGVLKQMALRSTSTVSSQKMKEKEVFHDALPGIVDNLMMSPKLSKLPEVADWVKKVLDHNLTGGKHSRGLMTMFAYEMLEKPELITEENLKLSRVLGWCLEMLQGYFCAVDDIMDGSTTRRGMPCWYRMPNVGMGALNDCILMSSCITETLETYFLKSPQFVELVRLFHEAIVFTSMGQHIDYTMAHRAQADYSLFTMDRYDTIVQYKTSYYTFRLPVLLGLSLVKHVDQKMYADVDDISFKLGKLFQMQDDYIDCYGDEAITGKAGTDIQEGKCTWLAVTALEHCNESQRKLFEKYYASKDIEEVAIIKTLYNGLQIPNLYKQKENELHENIVHRVRQLPSETAPTFFFKLIDQLYKRNR
ncbi:unnamed protein product [Arctia plantaginis]|uniref:Farnesyl pyrophosphate synthase n=1 Tax=Arctia plantaginis TaxID=874455 RepID=A0A8S0Z9Q7_ARCPL|nr:unnamed protein product [Arctia plantaginis]CAB3257011.1 unnamed protein product [Arctia plantaginis]